MRTIAVSALRDFWEKHPDAETPLRAWNALASRAEWRTPSDIKAAYGSASFTANNRVAFNIKGKDYRLVLAAHYDRGMMSALSARTANTTRLLSNRYEGEWHGTEANSHQERLPGGTGGGLASVG